MRYWSLHFKTTPSARKIWSYIIMEVLKWRDIYFENIRMVSLIAGLIMEGFVGVVLNCRDHCIDNFNTRDVNLTERCLTT